MVITCEVLLHLRIDRAGLPDVGVEARSLGLEKLGIDGRSCSVISPAAW